ncbi:MAG: ATP-binding protein [Actinomycetota bacterium]|nr:ATP-binding protein [Actinomycetota bacterium]
MYPVTVSLPASAEAPKLAREFVHTHRDGLTAEIIADAQLLVSEVVTNAVRHGRPDITLAMRLTPPGLAIVVADTGAALPVVPEAPPGLARPSGRGLLILDAVATAWGVTPSASRPGKAVWFELQPR